MEQSISNLRNSGLKITPQRIAIYKYLLGTYSHPTAQTIYQEIKKQYPSISFATVYKTLNVLRDANLILEFNVGGDCFRYDANVMSHPHFICKTCHEVSDLAMPSDTNFETILLTANKGFKIDHSDMYLYGVCNICNE